LDAGTAKLRLAFHIVENKTGGLTATLDSLDQNARGIPVQEVTFADGCLSLKLAAIKAEFVSTLNAQGTLLTGTFTQQSINFAGVVKLSGSETVVTEMPRLARSGSGRGHCPPDCKGSRSQQPIIARSK
jgi:hypothetical protein